MWWEKVEANLASLNIWDGARCRCIVLTHASILRHVSGCFGDVSVGMFGMDIPCDTTVTWMAIMV